MTDIIGIREYIPKLRIDIENNNNSVVKKGRVNHTELLPLPEGAEAAAEPRETSRESRELREWFVGHMKDIRSGKYDVKTENAQQILKKFGLINPGSLAEVFPPYEGEE